MGVLLEGACVQPCLGQQCHEIHPLPPIYTWHEKEVTLYRPRSRRGSSSTCARLNCTLTCTRFQGRAPTRATMSNSRAVSIDVSLSELVDVSLAASRSPNSLMIAKYTSRVAKPCGHCHVVTDRAPPSSRTARRRRHGPPRRHGPRAAVVTGPANGVDCTCLVGYPSE